MVIFHSYVKLPEGICHSTGPGPGLPSCGTPTPGTGVAPLSSPVAVSCGFDHTGIVAEVRRAHAILAPKMLVLDPESQLTHFTGHTHMILVWYIYLHHLVIFRVNVGKYTIHGAFGIVVVII